MLIEIILVLKWYLNNVIFYQQSSRHQSESTTILIIYEFTDQGIKWDPVRENKYTLRKQTDPHEHVSIQVILSNAERVRNEKYLFQFQRIVVPHENELSVNRSSSFLFTNSQSCVNGKRFIVKDFRGSLLLLCFFHLIYYTFVLLSSKFILHFILLLLFRLDLFMWFLI